MLKRFKKLIFKNDDINRFQQEVSQTFNQITDIKFLDGIKINASLKVGDTEINHGLGKSLTGVIMTKKSGLGDYYIKSMSDSKLIVNANAAFDAEFWIF